MSRCSKHRCVEPCFYCQKGVQAFSSTGSHLDAMEDRICELEQGKEKLLKAELQRSNGVIRMGGVGDLAILSSSLKALKAKEPMRPLVLVTKREHMDLFRGAEYLDDILPVDLYAETEFWRRYDLRWAVEDDKTHKSGTLSVEDYLAKDRSDVFDELLGVTGSGKQFSLPIEPGALKLWKQKFKSLARPLIGIAATSTQVLRDIPINYIEPLAKMLQEASGGTVLLFGVTAPRNQSLANIEGEQILNYINQTAIPDLVAAISLLDCMVSPDTGPMHIAGVLGIKTLALMSYIPPQCRITYYPTATPLHPKGELPCIPCYGISEIPGQGSLPCKQPNKIAGECMQLMTPERIVGEVKKMLDIPEPKKVAFVHDYSLEIDGGAEISSRMVVKRGRELKYNIQVFSMENNKNDFYNLFKFDLIILSNLWDFDFERMDIIMEAIKEVPYVKYVHDHRGLEELAVGKYPMETFTKPLFQNSLLNIYLSPLHKETHEKFFENNSCLFLSPVDINKYKPVPGVERKSNTALVGVPRKHFNAVGYLPANDAGLELRTYMEEHPEITFDFLYQKVSGDSMPELYSRYEYFIHLPQGEWACDRMPTEAALCGCKVITSYKSGVLSWGKDLSDMESLREWLSKSPDPFWEEIGKLLNRGEEWTLPLKVSTG